MIYSNIIICMSTFLVSFSLSSRTFRTNIFLHKKIRKATANLKATSERESLYALEHELKTKKDILLSTQDSLDVSQRKFEKLKADEKNLLERTIMIESKAKICRDELVRVRKDHGDLQARRVQTS